MSEIVDEDGARSYRVRRQRRSVIVIAVVLLALAGAFYYASTYFRATEPQAGPCTTEPVGVPLKPGDVSLNVYNATKRAGLASAASKTAIDRGFKVKTVGNDPKESDHQAERPGALRPGRRGVGQAARPRAQGAKLSTTSARATPIDLVLGNTWKSFGAGRRPRRPRPHAAPLPDGHRRGLSPSPR